VGRGGVSDECAGFKTHDDKIITKKNNRIWNNGVCRKLCRYLKVE